MRSAQDNFFTRTGAVKDQPFIPQPLHGGKIRLVALALPDNLSIPMQTQLLQGGQNFIGRTWYHAGRIKVFHTQQPQATFPASQTVATDCGDQ
jgi:hypothetical protein